MVKHHYKMTGWNRHRLSTICLNLSLSGWTDLSIWSSKKQICAQITSKSHNLQNAKGVKGTSRQWLIKGFVMSEKKTGKSNHVLDCLWSCGTWRRYIDLIKTQQKLYARSHTFYLESVSFSVSIKIPLTTHNWQKWKRVFLTCPCHKIYRDEAVRLKSCKYTWKITIFVKMWNLRQFR